jgi:hypothetical protein
VLLWEDMIQSIRYESRILRVITREIGVGELADSGDIKDGQTSRFVLALSRDAPVN